MIISKFSNVILIWCHLNFISFQYFKISAAANQITARLIIIVFFSEKKILLKRMKKKYNFLCKLSVHIRERIQNLITIKCKLYRFLIYSQANIHFLECIELCLFCRVPVFFRAKLPLTSYQFRIGYVQQILCNLLLIFVFCI